MTNIESLKFNAIELREICKWQKHVIYLYTIGMLVMVLVGHLTEFGTYQIPIFQIISVAYVFYIVYAEFKLVKSIHLKIWMFLISFLIPVAHLVYIIYAIRKANLIFKHNNICVGLFGARVADINKHEISKEVIL